MDNAGNTSSTQSVNFIVLVPVYVSTGGNDTNDGLTRTTPVRSIQTGISRAVGNNLRTILVTIGLYTPGNEVKF
ncbi:MAG: hypothetical protein ABDH28_05250 [Brevinematia bacterium]